MDIVKFEDLDKHISPQILLDIAEIQKPRSLFQLEKFVVGQHDTKEMQYYQTLLEIQSLYYTIKQASLEMKKIEIEILRLRSTGDEIDEIDAQIKELGLEQTRVVGIGAFRELKDLIDIYNSFDKKYTREEIEISQPDYWAKRLNRQVILEMSGGSSAAAAHLDSLRQMGAIEVSKDGLSLIDSYLNENNQIEN